MNELSTLAKFISSVISGDADANVNFGDRFYSEVIPDEEPITSPALMFVTGQGRDTRGAFNQRLKTSNVYQIKAIIENTDFAPLGSGADDIDRLFDWQNQIDPDAGRPKSQVVYTDPDDDNKQIMIMSMKRVSNIRYCNQINGVNYCHLGGEYEIEYYIIDSLLQPVTIGDETMTQADYLQSQIANFGTRLGTLEMAFSNYQPSGIEPVIAVTAASPTIAPATVNTVYKVAPTANQQINLPPANGNGVVYHFDFQALGSYTSQFILNGSDTYVASNTGTSTATNIQNAINAGGASISLRSLVAGVWSIE